MSIFYKVKDTKKSGTVAQSNTLTKADLLQLLQHHDDDTEVTVIINQQDIDKVRTLSSSSTTPFEFELSKLHVKENNTLKINAWVHSSRTQKAPILFDNMQTTNPAVTEQLVKHQVKGVVKWFNLEKGLGFIQSADVPYDIFIYHAYLGDINAEQLTPGVELSFSLYVTGRGLRAKSIKLI